MSENISTRNLFAAAALQGLLAGRSISQEPRTADDIAATAFQLADAMEKLTTEARREHQSRAQAEELIRHVEARRAQTGAT